jgi:hypothetical protein
MRLHAVLPGGGAPRQQPLIAHFAAAVIMVDCQSSVLAGNRGNGGRQMQQGGGGDAHLSVVGPPLGVALQKQWSLTELHSKLCAFSFN